MLSRIVQIGRLLLIDALQRPKNMAFRDNSALQGCSLLLLEDEILIAMELEMIFQREGASVVLAADEASAHEALDESSTPIDIAVLDVRLGAADQFTVAERLHAEQIPFMFHSGHARAKDLSECFPGSAAVIKPASPDLLVSVVERLLGRSHA